jgi:hypothetical protein
MIADATLKMEQDFDGVNIVYNRFMSVIAYECRTIAVPRLSALEVARMFQSLCVNACF